MAVIDLEEARMSRFSDSFVNFSNKIMETTARSISDVSEGEPDFYLFIQDGAVEIGIQPINNASDYRLAVVRRSALEEVLKLVPEDNKHRLLIEEQLRNRDGN